MRIADLIGKKIVIWGLGREGKAVAELIRRQAPDQPLIFIDEKTGGDCSFLAPADRALFEPEQIAAAINEADIIVKSPGVSLYHPLLCDKKPTSLLNLWLAEPRTGKIIGVTGTKGKSTTSSLLAHVLNATGHSTELLGNIGVPVSQGKKASYAVIEISSYQAANLSEECDIGIVTSLYPEHLDWHGSLETYYRDKLNLLTHSKIKIINAEALRTAREHNIPTPDAVTFNNAAGFHVRDGKIYHGELLIGKPDNTHLMRAHNLINVCAVLTVLREIGIGAERAMACMQDFRGLPHRQEELGEKNGILFVDDSISTTPLPAIAAMESYAPRPVTLLAGGFDRGIDYDVLTDYLRHKNIHAVICMGNSGKRIYDAVNKKMPNAFYAASLDEAVTLAKRKTPKGGVILLSPAAPSYGMFKDFEERGRAFAALAQLGQQG